VVVFRWLHDALLEDLLDRAEVAVGTEPAGRRRRTMWVRLLMVTVARPANGHAGSGHRHTPSR
jgi:hypothetical protein